MVEHEYSTDVLPYDESMVAFFETLPELSLDRRLAAQYMAAVSLRKELELAEERAQYDDLTGLMRRSAFDQEFQRHIDQQEAIAQKLQAESTELRHGDAERLGLVLINIDLDDFSEINNSLGHPVGDEALVRVAEVIGGSVRDHDIVCRNGGDEFLVLLNEGVDLMDVYGVASRIREGLLDIQLAQQRGYVGASIGFSAFEPGMTIEDMIREADEDMYVDKASKQHR